MQVLLKNGKAEGIVDTLGGELISYKNDGKEYLWIGDGQYWTGHAPVLFPVVGALTNDKVLIDGREYSIKKHGFARKSQQRLVEQTENKAVLELDCNEETLKMYPYRFKLTITHNICEKGFKTTYKVTNTDDKPITFAIGGHAGFLTGNIEEYKLVFEQNETFKLYYTDEKSIISDKLVHSKKIENTNEYSLLYSDYDNDALVAKDIKSRKIKLIRKDDGTGIEFDFTGFDVLGIWTPPHKKAPFLCLEPWNGIPAYDNETGKFEDKPYVVTLDCGKEYEVGYSCKVIK